MKSNKSKTMHRYHRYTLVIILSFFCNIESGFSQVNNPMIGEVVSINVDSLPCYEKRMEQTNVMYKIPSGFNKCNYNSIRIADCVFKYVPSLPNLRPGVIQSQDKQVLVLLCGPYLFSVQDSIEAVKARINRFAKIHDSKDSIDGIDFARYSPSLRHRYHMQDYSDGVVIYPCKTAKAFFNADSMFIWRRPSEKTNNLFVVDTVNVSNKIIQRLDEGYNIKDEPFWKYYSCCKTMVIQKNDTGYIPVHIYFTERGLKHEEKYIRALKRLFWFPEDCKNDRK